MTTLVAIAGLLCFATVATACPTCKDAIGGDPHAANMVNGYFWSILFMMSMPFLILFGLSTYFYMEVRRARREGVASPGSSLSRSPGGANADALAPDLS